MKVIVFVKATADSEAGVMPSEQMLTEMGKFNEELVEAGIILSGEGLHPSSKGARVRFSGKDRSVIDGPFAETKELVAGYWVWQVKSMDEAIAWVKKCPNPMNEDSEIEIRPIFEMEDFGEALTPELREQEERLRVAVEGYQLDAPRWEVGRQRIIAGLKKHFTDETREEIPQLWASFGQRRSELTGAVGQDTYGVCQGGGDNGFDYLAGVEVKIEDGLPSGVTALTLEAQRYAVFSYDGHVSGLPQFCCAIWGKWLPNSGHHAAEAPFFERYTENFNSETLSGGVEVWIPIKA